MREPVIQVNQKKRKGKTLLQYHKSKLFYRCMVRGLKGKTQKIDGHSRARAVEYLGKD